MRHITSKRRPPSHLVYLSALWLMLLAYSPAQAQMERQLANPGGPVDDIFWAPTIISAASVMNLPAGNINFSIQHSFGIATDGSQTLFGLDDPANIRFGLDFGVVDGLSFGFGRSRFDKLWDFRFKANVLRQSKDDRMPVELAIKGDFGINTVKNPDFDFVDRLNYLSAIMLARRFSDRVSLQVMPMWSHFNTVFIEDDGQGGRIEEQNDHFAVGLAGRFALNERFALLVEYLPVIGDRTTGTVNAFAAGMEIDTGGHVFQIFLTSSQWTTEQHTIARNTDDFFKGDFRIGFNVNRVFGL